MAFGRKKKQQQTYLNHPGFVTGATGPTVPWYSTAIPPALPPQQPDPVPLKDMGLAIEPIIGLRSFYVDADAMLLCSYNHTPWPQQHPLYAYCGNDVLAEHEVPYEHCSCGIYAWRQDLIHCTTGNLYGEVYLWGDVLVCDSGYRAETAYPKSLTIKAIKTRSSLRIRDGLQEAYGIPVTLVDPDPPASLQPPDLNTFTSFTFKTTG